MNAEQLISAEIAFLSGELEGLARRRRAGEVTAFLRPLRETTASLSSLLGDAPSSLHPHVVRLLGGCSQIRRSLMH